MYETLCVCVCERETTEHCERESDPASTADGAPRERLSLSHSTHTQLIRDSSQGYPQVRGPQVHPQSHSHTQSCCVRVRTV